MLKLALNMRALHIVSTAKQKRFKSVCVHQTHGAENPRYLTSLFE